MGRSAFKPYLLLQLQEWVFFYFFHKEVGIRMDQWKLSMLSDLKST